MTSFIKIGETFIHIPNLCHILLENQRINERMDENVSRKYVSKRVWLLQPKSNDEHNKLSANPTMRYKYANADNGRI